MQLDKTRIVVRERNALESMDLALLVLREYLRPIALTFTCGVVPLALFNAWLIGWMAEWTYQLEGEESFPVRFAFNMSMLVFLEAPLATVFITGYLGQAVFLDQPALRHVMLDVLRMSARLFWCQGVVRGLGVALLLASVISPDWDSQGFDVLLFLLTCGIALLRSLRPFVNEIALLERNPLYSSNKSVMTVGRRSTLLHGAVGGDLFVQWIAAAMIGVGLVGALGYAFYLASGLLTNDWSWNVILTHVGLPLAFWLVAGFFAIVRFLNYLDARIRQEGWEVELHLRAEAARMAQRLA